MTNTPLAENVKIAAAQFIREKEYWKKKLTGIQDKNCFPYDYPGTGSKQRTRQELPFKLPRELLSGLMGLSKQSDPKLHMILTTALAALLAKYTGRSDILVGTPIDKQNTHQDTGTNNNSANLVNTILPLRIQLMENITFKELLLQVRTTINEAIAHQNYPVESLEFPLFDAAIILEDLQDRKYLEHLDHNLTFIFVHTNEHVNGIVEYNQTLYNRETTRRIIYHFLRLLEIALADIDIKITGIQLLSEEEKKQIKDFNNTSTLYPGHKTIHRLFAEQAEQSPDRIAIMDMARTTGTGEVFLTYRELNQKSTQLAHRLQTKGVKPGTIVPLVGNPSIETLVGIFGILKAGGAFLPIDPRFPAQRIDYILADSGAKILVTTLNLIKEEMLRTYESKTNIEIILLDFSTILSLSPSNPGPPSFPHQDLSPRLNAPAISPAYIIYTSGSAGRPKGVIIEHRGLVNYTWWAAKHYTRNQSDRFAFYTALSFDLTITSIFVPLITGNTIVVYHGEEREFLIERIIKEDNIEVMKVTPTHLQLMRSKKQGIPTNLKRIIVGGEQLNTQLTREIYQNFNEKIEIYNEYGPTETVVGCMLYQFNPQKDTGFAVPIGKPADNVNIYLLDKHWKPLPVGIPGEIYISGHGTARGYLNQPQLTSERFIRKEVKVEVEEEVESFALKVPGKDQGKDHIQSYNHAAMQSLPHYPIYLTGDLARWLQSGNIEFLGRIDHQVKIRGFRIELGEVENQLLNHEHIKEAAVISRGDETNSNYLCAYIVPADESAPEQTSYVVELREYLSQLLPDYMIPRFFVPMDKLPVTLNGKLDRDALPDPLTSVEAGVEYRAPRSDIESIVARVWEEILGREKIGIDDGFFDLGGDSVKAIQISAGLQQHNLKMEIADLFQYRTIGELSSFVTPLEVRVPQEPVEGPVPLTPIQKWFFEKETAWTHHFNMSVLLYRQETFDQDILENVFNCLIIHHDALRMEYKVHSDAAVIQFNRGIPGFLQLTPLLEVVDLRNQPGWQKIIEKNSMDIQCSINLTRGGPLVKPCLFKTSAGDYLLIAVHHLVMDGVSWRIFLEDFEILYKVMEKKEEPGLPLKTTSFKEWAEKLYAYANNPGEPLIKEMAYWEKIQQTPVPTLPKDKIIEPGKNKMENNRQEEMVLSREDTERLLKDVHRAFNTEINEILLTALGLAVKEWAGLDTLVIDMEGHGREEILEQVNITRTIGWFTVVYPLVIDMKQANDLAALIKQTKEMLRQVPSRGIGFGIIRYLTTPGNKQNLAFKQVPEIGFNYLGQFGQDIASDLYRFANIPYADSISKEFVRPHTLEISGMIVNQVLSIGITYNKEEYTSQKIARLAESYRENLVRVIHFCVSREETELTVSDLSSDDFSQGEMDSILDELQDTFSN